MVGRRYKRRNRRWKDDAEQDADAAGESKRKPPWQLFLESSGGTAMITVLIGGIAASCVTAIIQSGSQAREFQDAWLKARGDQALIAYKEYLEQEQQTVKRAYELIGDCISASQDVITLTTPEFAPGSRHGLGAQRESMLKRWNEVNGMWRRENAKLGLLMSYYHRGSPEVSSAWNEASHSITAYMICATTWFSQYPDHPAPADKLEAGVCQVQEGHYKESLTKLSSALDKTRQYAWEGWESPQRMKKQLEETE